MTQPGKNETLSLGARIDTVCDSFEGALRSGGQPVIEDYLSHVPEAAQPELLVELVGLEVDYRRRSGEHPSLKEYNSRFSSYARLLRDRLGPEFDSADRLYETTYFDAGNSPVSDADPQQTLTTGQYLGRYQLLDFLGRGGFGEVWSALDTILERRVAIKTLRTDRAFPAEAVDSFLAEGRKLANLKKHPGIVGVYDVGYDRRRRFIVSELIEGQTLGERIGSENAPLSRSQKIEMVASVAEALHFAHLQGIVHRDVKPSNILLDTDGGAHLTDFGLAVSEEEQLSEPHAIVGTISYMPPEQVTGSSHHADARSDVYSLGTVLYLLLTGRLPFVAHSIEQYQDQVLHRDPRPLRTIDDSIDPELERICLKCLAKPANQRYTTAADLAKDLRAASAGRMVSMRRLVMGAAVLACVAVIAYSMDGQIRGTGVTPPSPESSPPELAAIRPEFSLPDPLADPLGWKSRLGQLPQELIFPGYRGTSSADFDIPSRAYRVTSNAPRLYALGQLDDRPCTVSVGLRQLVWNDSAGLFLGYRIENRHGAPCAAFQAVAISRRRRNDEEVLVASRSISIVDPVSGQFSDPVELGEQIVQWPGESEVRRLELQLDDTGLSHARWGREELSILTHPYSNSQLTPEDYQGAWGVVSVDDITWIQDPTVVNEDLNEIDP